MAAAPAAGPNYSTDLNDVAALHSPLTAILPAPVAQAVAQSGQLSALAGPAPRVAVLLPASGPLADAGQVLRQGIEAAWKVDADAELAWYDTEADNVRAQYQRALDDGASVVIGPLAREAVAELASIASVPTLALNTVSGSAAPTLYAFHLAVESEGAQMALAMHRAGHLFPLLVVGADPLSQRLAQGWRAAWTDIHGRSPRWVVQWPAERARLNELATQADAVVLAVPGRDWPALHPLLSALPAYAAASLSDFARPQLAWPGVVQLDMPWLLSPQAAPAARYPRPAEPLTLATERLYAQGIDAFRLARRLAGRDTPGLTLDGVTGWLSLRGREVQRSLRAVDE